MKGIILAGGSETGSEHLTITCFSKTNIADL